MLPGERAEVRVLKVKGEVGYGRVEEIVTPAEERVRPKCPVFLRCGGCQLQHIRYRDQLKFKSKLVRDSLKKIAGIQTAEPKRGRAKQADAGGLPAVEACERSEREYGYRNKLQLPVGRRDGQNVIGFYAERSHRMIPITVCPIHPAWSEQIIAATLNFMEKCGLDGYDEETKTGQVRHLVVRELKKKHIVTLVVTEKDIKGIDYYAFLLDKIFSEYSLFLNVNPADTNVVFGEEFHLVKGKETYECSDMGITFDVGPNTFVQVNDGVRAKLYQSAVELAQGGPVIDCYAGGGLLTALFARAYGKAYGIEIVPEASECSKHLAEQNGLSDCMTSILGSVEEHLPALLKEEKEAVVVLDPPRAGVERSVIKTILSARPKRILMISCNPATLARDLGLLTGTLAESETGELLKCAAPQGAYEIERIKPYDMFPQTKHVETLVVLRRSDSAAES